MYSQFRRILVGNLERSAYREAGLEEYGPRIKGKGNISQCCTVPNKVTYSSTVSGRSFAVAEPQMILQRQRETRRTRLSPGAVTRLPAALRTSGVSGAPESEAARSPAP